MYSIVLLHSYSCPDLLGFCTRMRSTCSILYSCLFPFFSPFSHLATASAIPISCVLCVRVCVPQTYPIVSLQTKKKRKRSGKQRLSNFGAQKIQRSLFAQGLHAAEANEATFSSGPSRLGLCSERDRSTSMDYFPSKINASSPW